MVNSIMLSLGISINSVWAPSRATIWIVDRTLGGCQWTAAPLAIGSGLMALSIGGLWVSHAPWVALAKGLLLGVGNVICTTTASASAPPSGLGQWLAQFGAAANWP
jgi:hypothetical protein